MKRNHIHFAPDVPGGQDIISGVCVLCVANIYRIAGNFDVFDAFQPDHQNLTHQIFKAMQHLVKDSD